MRWGCTRCLSPFWLPRALMHDDSMEAHFPRFPYDNTPGYLMSDAWLSGFTADKVLAETLADATGSQSRCRTARTAIRQNRRKARW